MHGWLLLLLFITTAATPAYLVGSPAACAYNLVDGTYIIHPYTLYALFSVVTSYYSTATYIFASNIVP
jgi:hypothetical protein